MNHSALRLFWRLPMFLAAFAAVSTARGGEPVPTALFDYVATPQPDFGWEIKGAVSTGDGTVTEVRLVSQKWQNIVWRHALYIYQPKNLALPNHCLLFVTGGRTGGSPSLADMTMGMQLARVAGSAVAVLHHVPNQPLMGNKVEDDLITETMLKYLETGDKTWPLLFPMVNSAVKAMDAVQQIGEKEWKRPIKTFVVTGASKRGWTSWLTAAADQRVIGLAPIVIDTLNFAPQMKHQMETWGAYSEQIEDYTRKGLIAAMEKDPNIPLWKWMDPYTYREKITQPKLIVNGANDRYWTLDALNIYWNDLKGPKYVHYAPNGGHNLGPGRERALATVGVFSRLTAMGKPMPKLEWSFEKNGSGQKLHLKSDVAPKEVLVWTTTSPTKDFRPAKWEPKPMSKNGDGFVAEVSKPSSGHYAIHGAATYEFDKVPITLSTQMSWE
jgi:PhoPQ-activated pathogenicity-related protein